VIRAALLWLLLLPFPLAAQEAIEAPGILPDDAFFRLVACAAPPGGACQKPLARWEATRPIRVALRQIDPAFLGRKKLRANAALERALQELNGAEAGFRLARVAPDARAEIEVFFLDLEAGEEITGTGIVGVDGAELAAASTRILFNHSTGLIERAAIVVSTTLETPVYESAMLEELAQAMGLSTEIGGPAYAGVSVFAAGDSTVTALGTQDLMALRRHYARR